MKLSLEKILTSPHGFGLETASPLQRAICRALDGRELGDYWDNPVVRDAFGGTAPPVGAPPREFIILAAIRSAKSLIAAAAAVRAALTCNVENLRAGEVPRVSVISITRDLANVTFQHICGSIQTSPQLSSILVDEPGASSLVLMHPAGRHIEIQVAAGARAGSSLVARWSAGVIFDEAPRMTGADDGVVNLEHARQAVLGRMLPGAQIAYIGSPWQPYGPIYDWTQEHFGNPTEQLVVVRARGPDMNPVYWTPEKCEELRNADPQTHRTDVLGEFADPETAAFPSDELDKCTFHGDYPIPPQDNHQYVAWMDPATRGNAWTFVIVTCTGRGGDNGITPQYQVVNHAEWVPRPGSPLSPRVVLGEISEMAFRYGLDTVGTDQYAADALKDLADEHGLFLRDEALTPKINTEIYTNLRTRVHDHSISIPADKQLRKDLQLIKRRTTEGGFRYVLPKTSDGRHCDYAPSLAAALMHPPLEPTVHESKPTDHFAATRRRIGTQEPNSEATTWKRHNQ